jgi:hypothetical protein
MALWPSVEPWDLFAPSPRHGTIRLMSTIGTTIDRKDKFAQYRKAGVRFCWIVDPQLKTIEGWELKKRR